MAKSPSNKPGGLRDIAEGAAKGASGGGLAGAVAGGAKALTKNDSFRKFMFGLGAAAIVMVMLIGMAFTGTSNQGADNDRLAANDNATAKAQKAGLTDAEYSAITTASTQYGVPWEVVAATYLYQKVAPTDEPVCETPSGSGGDVESMDTATLAGQHVMVGVYSGDDKVKEATKAIDESKLSGVFLLGSWLSKDAIQKATTEIQKHSVADMAPIIDADREGGQIQLNGGRAPAGWENVPSALEQGKMKPEDLKKKWVKWGTELKDAGVTNDFAPVADTADGKENSGSVGRYDRQYGSDPKKVAPLVKAAAEGLKEAGVTATAKHFPGLGYIKENTDFEGAKSDITDTRTTENDLDTFKAAIDAGTNVMVSSAYYDKIDPSNQAVFSKKIITDILRGKLGFSGVVFSDEIGSAKSMASTPVGERAVKFVDAGGDMALAGTPADAKTMADALKAKADKDPAFKKKLQDSMTRIAAMKQGASTSSDCPASTDSPTTSNVKSITVYGDSVSVLNAGAYKKSFELKHDGKDETHKGGAMSKWVLDKLEPNVGKIDTDGVVIATGSNDNEGTFEGDRLKELVGKIKDKPVVLVLPRTADGYAQPQDGVRKAIEEAAKGRDNVKIADWYSLSKDHTKGSKDSWFKDNVHPNEKGSEAYVKLVQDTFGTGGGSDDAATVGGEAGESKGNDDRSKWTLAKAQGTESSVEEAKKSGNRYRLLMEVAKYAQKQGWQLGEHPEVGKVAPVHTSGSLHYTGMAFDLNYGGGGANPQEKAAADKLMPILRSSTIGWIWQSPGHLDHIHIDAGGWYSYNPQNPGVNNFKCDGAKGKIPAVGGGYGGYSPSNKVMFEDAPKCDVNSDAGESKADDVANPSTGGNSESNPDYISAFRIPKKDVDAKDQKTINDNVRASASWVAEHLNKDAKQKPQDMTTHLVTKKAAGVDDSDDPQANPTWYIEEDDKEGKKAQEDVKKTWVDALVSLKLDTVDEAKAGQIYDTALAWLKGEDSAVDSPDATDASFGGAGGGISSEVPEKYREAIQKAGSVCPEVTPNDVAAILYIESGFATNPRTHTPHDGGVLGIAQMKLVAQQEVENHGKPTHYDEHGNPLPGKGNRDNDWDGIGMAGQLLCIQVKATERTKKGGQDLLNGVYAYNQGLGGWQSQTNHGSTEGRGEGKKYVKMFLEARERFGKSTAANTVGAGPGSALGKKAAELMVTKVGLKYSHKRQPNGLPYIEDSADCSSLVVWAYWEASGRKLILPTTTQLMVADTKQLDLVKMNGPHDLSQAQVGDIILFNGIRGNPPWGHAGMYIGNGRMMEAKNEHMPAGIVELKDAYWQKLQWKIMRPKAAK